MYRVGALLLIGLLLPSDILISFHQSLLASDLLDCFSELVIKAIGFDFHSTA